MNKVRRFDTIDAPQWMTSKFEKTKEGYLKGRAVICTTGVYEYKLADGTIQRELRLPEEVFSTVFLDSLKLKPLTLNHPSEGVDAKNIKKYQIGNLGNNPSSPPDGNTDMYNLSIDMIIQDAEAVMTVENGQRELSVGYEVDLEPAEPGARWCGQPYDVIQRNLFANHVSVVDKARAGDTARIRLDSLDAELVQDVANATDYIDKEAKMPDLKKYKLDGVEYEAEAPVITALNKAKDRNDELESENKTLTLDKTKVEAERDGFKDRIDELEKELETAKSKKLDEAEIKAAVERRVKILDAAHVAKVEVTDSMDEVAIQKAVITSIYPNAKLDDKDAVYIDARFDGAIDELERRNDGKVRELAGDASDTSSVAQEARKKMLARLEKKEA